jgi:hypothetical protein
VVHSTGDNQQHHCAAFHFFVDVASIFSLLQLVKSNSVPKLILLRCLVGNVLHHRKKITVVTTQEVTD